MPGQSLKRLQAKVVYAICKTSLARLQMNKCPAKSPWKFASSCGSDCIQPLKALKLPHPLPASSASAIASLRFPSFLWAFPGRMSQTATAPKPKGRPVQPVVRVMKVPHNPHLSPQRPLQNGGHEPTPSHSPRQPEEANSTGPLCTACLSITCCFKMTTRNNFKPGTR